MVQAVFGMHCEGGKKRNSGNEVMVSENQEVQECSELYIAS